jgi:hypothetical protein
MRDAPGWIESDVEPPHRGEAAEDAFRAACMACPHRRGPIELDPSGGSTWVKCAICACPLGYVVHRYRPCPAGKVPPPEIP